MRVLMLMAAMAMLALAACDDDGGGSRGDAPPQVHDDASLVEDELHLESGEDDDDAVRVLADMQCADGVLTVETNRETIYAELPCDRMLPEESVERFRGHPVAIESAEGGDIAKLYLESEDGGNVEFTVGRTWRLER